MTRQRFGWSILFVYYFIFFIYLYLFVVIGLFNEFNLRWIKRKTKISKYKINHFEKSNNILGTDGFLNAFNSLRMYSFKGVFCDYVPSFMLSGFLIVSCGLHLIFLDHKLQHSFHMSQTLEIIYCLWIGRFRILFEHTTINSPDLLVLQWSVDHENFSEE